MLGSRVDFWSNEIDSLPNINLCLLEMIWRRSQLNVKLLNGVLAPHH